MKMIESDSRRLYAELNQKLTLHNYVFTKNELLNPEIYNKEGIKEGFYLLDGEDVAGGCYFFIDPYNWMNIELMWVSEKHRGKDYGTKLIQKTIEKAKKLKCHGIRVETWDFQAKGFYMKNGFKQYGELKNHPKGITDYSLSIDLC